MHKKLFIPGPTEVGPEILAELARPQIGHRSGEFTRLYADLVAALKRFLRTRHNVYLATSSATGVMEGAVRNLVRERCLCLTCGAFSERWHKIALANGKEADALQVEWGEPNLPEEVERALASGRYDTVTLVHNETSTGVMNPLAEIAAAVRRHPGVLLAVDAVTSMAAVDLPIDELGLDLVFAGTQKAFGLPAGLTVLAASPRALERAAGVPHRGLYFDLLDFEKYHQRNQTPATPSIPLFYALRKRLEQIEALGREAWFGRHLAMARRCREWAERHFALLPRRGYESVSLTAIRNTRGISVAALNEELGRRGMTLSNGYGKLKEQSLRIGHMGDIGLEDLDRLLAAIEEVLHL
jgi:aspartate aminotransferase-like enzyme